MNMKNLYQFVFKIEGNSWVTEEFGFQIFYLLKQKLQELHINRPRKMSGNSKIPSVATRFLNRDFNGFR